MKLAFCCLAASAATALFGCAASNVSPGAPIVDNRVVAAYAYADLPMSFTANQGQADTAVKFLARGQGYSVVLIATDAVLALHGRSAGPGSPSGIVRMRLVEANAAPVITGLDRLAGTSNFFAGNDPSRWQRDVPGYARVKYTAVYPGIDQIYYGNQRQLEYDFVVAAHADPSRIRIAFEGVQALTLDREGNLLLQTPGGTVTQQRPTIYQDIDGARQRVDGRYALGANSHVRFEIGAYDMRHALVIDPVLSYATFLGGNSNDVGHAIALDGEGNVFITGETLSTDFPGVGAGSIQPSKLGASNSPDVFVTKMNAAGSAIVYSTYLGGSGADRAYAIALDGSGNAYLTGETDSQIVSGTGTQFPTTAGAFQQVYGLGGDAFVTKINAAGNGLVYSTYLGGSGFERASGIAIDSAGSAYVTGHTNSAPGSGSFPIAAAFQPLSGGSVDAFVTKLNASGSELVYSTHLGGTASEYSIYGGAIAVDGAGNAYVGGTTASLNFPGANASTIQPANGSGFNDGFVVKFNAGGGLVYSTYLGGAGYDEINGLAINSDGDVFVAGYTDSIDFPTIAPLQPSKGIGNDAFVSRVNAAGSALVYSTYLGGSGSDIAHHLAVDSASNAYVAGFTQSSDFPVLQPFQTSGFGSGDAFVTALTAAGNALVYSSRIGGSFGVEHAQGVALDGSANAYLTGQTNSTNFPTANPLQATLGTPGTDAFVVKVSAPAPTVLGSPTNLIATAIAGNTVTVAWTAPANSITPTGYVLEGGVAPGEVLASIATGSPATTFTFIAPTGAYYIRLHAVAGAMTSGPSNEIRIFVNVPAPPSAPANLLGLVNASDLSLAWINTAGGGTPSDLLLDVTGTLTATLGIPVSENFSFSNVPAGTYTLSLRAVNAAGASAPSNSVTLTFPAPCSGAPATPAAFAVTRLGSVVTASWSLPGGGPAPTAYLIKVTGAFTGEFVLQARSLAGAVGPGSYTLTVTATNPCGASAPSAAQTVTIP
jgi:hypothetical protein